MLSRYVFGEDIFVSYSRRDGMNYATALASELTSRGFACHIDVYDTQPGKDMPDSLTAALKRSFLLVVVGSEGAADSRHVGLEIETFAALGGHMIVLDFDGAVERAYWRASVEGLGWKKEPSDDLTLGQPAASTIGLIENSFRFRKRNQRLAITFWTVTAGVVLLLAIGAVSGIVIRRNIAQARTELSETNTQLGDATRNLARTQTDLAKSDRELDVAKADLSSTRADLTTAQQETELQGQVATAQRLRAELQGRRATSGYSGLGDALFSLQASRLFAAARMPAEAYAALVEGTTALPRFRHDFQNPGPLWSLALAPDGHTLLTSGGGLLRLWDYATGRQIGRPVPHDFLVRGAQISADGVLLVTSTMRAVQLWDSAHPDTPRTFPCPTGVNGGAVLSPSGAFLAFGCGEMLHVVRLDGEQYAPVSLTFGVNDLRFSPDDRYLTIKESDEVDFVTVLRLGPVIEKVPAVGECMTDISKVTLSRDGKYVLRSRRGIEFPVFGNNQVRVCDVPDLRVRALLPHSGATMEDISPDGSHVVTAEEGVIRLWETKQGRMVGTFKPGAFTRQAHFSRDGRYVLTDSLVVVDVPNARIAGVVPTSGANELSDLSGSGQIIAADGKTGRIAVWDTQSIQRGAAMNFGGRFQLARFSPSGSYIAVMSVDSDVTGNEFPEAVVWSLITGERILFLRAEYPYHTLRVAFHLDESQLAITYVSDDEDSPSKIEFRRLAAPGQPMSASNHTLLQDVLYDERRGWIGVAMAPPKAALFQLSDGREIMNWPRDAQASCEFRAYGRLVICSEGQRIWRTIDVQRAIEVTLGPLAAASDVSTSPSGGYYVAEPQASGLRISGFPGARPWTTSGSPANVAFSPGGKLLVATAKDRTEIWDLVTHSRIGLTAGASFGMLTPDQQSLLSVLDGHVEIRPWKTADFHSVVCNLLQRNIQIAGWNLLLDRFQFAKACLE